MWSSTVRPSRAGQCVKGCLHRRAGERVGGVRPGPLQPGRTHGHSMRHVYVEACVEGGVPEGWVWRLQGGTGRVRGVPDGTCACVPTLAGRPPQGVLLLRACLCRSAGYATGASLWPASLPEGPSAAPRAVVAWGGGPVEA